MVKISCFQTSYAIICIIWHHVVSCDVIWCHITYTFCCWATWLNWSPWWRFPAFRHHMTSYDVIERHVTSYDARHVFNSKQCSILNTWCHMTSAGVMWRHMTSYDHKYMIFPHSPALLGGRAWPHLSTSSVIWHHMTWYDIPIMWCHMTLRLYFCHMASYDVAWCHMMH